MKRPSLHRYLKRCWSNWSVAADGLRPQLNADVGRARLHELEIFT